MTKNELKIPDYIKNSQTFKDTLARLEAETDEILGVEPKKVEPDESLYDDSEVLGRCLHMSMWLIPICIALFLYGFILFGCVGLTLLTVCVIVGMQSIVAVENADTKKQFDKIQQIMNAPNNVPKIKESVEKRQEKELYAMDERRLKELHEKRVEFPTHIRELIHRIHHERFANPCNDYYMPEFDNHISKSIYEQELAAHNNA